MGSTLSVWRSSWLLIVVLMLCGCGRHPGREHAGEERDSAAVAEILADQRRAFESADEIIRFVKADSNRWVQHEFGWWYRYAHKSDAHINYDFVAPATDTCVVIHERVRTLDGRLIVDAIREYDTSGTFSEQDEPFVYQIMLRELVPEDTVVMLVPWVAGYGKDGKGFVPPETNLCIELTIENRYYEYENKYDFGMSSAVSGSGDVL